MSAPNPLFRDADSISCGFMTARASNLLRRVLEKKPISTDEVALLSSAERFLRDVADGAQFTASGAFREGANPTRSLAALDVAFGPIKVVRALVEHEANFAGLFEELASAVSKVKDTLSPEGVEDSLGRARQFFEALADWIANNLDSRNPVLGVRPDSLF
jgi:hypothetical protein